LLCEPNQTDAKWRSWEAKGLLVLQRTGLEDGSLAKLVYQEAEYRGWPGLGKEVTQICQNIGIPDINIHVTRKSDIQKALKISHHNHMIGQFVGACKLADIKNDNFLNIQSYFNDKDLESARMKFKIRTKMLERIPGNFKNKYKFQENGLKCNLCSEDMTQNHCRICPERVSLREDLDLENLDDLVTYFKLILTDKSLK
jgi:hypothetical protein